MLSTARSAGQYPEIQHRTPGWAELTMLPVPRKMVVPAAMWIFIVVPLGSGLFIRVYFLQDLPPFPPIPKRKE